jgi:hypothetical protein
VLLALETPSHAAFGVPSAVLTIEEESPTIYLPMALRNAPEGYRGRLTKEQ